MTTGSDLAPTSRLYDRAAPPLVAFAAARGDLAAGRDDPRALLGRCIATIADRDASVRAFVVTDFQAARAAADAGMVSAGGLPLGLQVMGYRDRDAGSVAVAAWIEPALRG